MMNLPSQIHIVICSIILFSMTLIGISTTTTFASKPITPRKICIELINAGHASFDRLEYANAMEQYRTASELCPSSDLFFWLADSYYKLEKCKDADTALFKISERQLKNVTIEKYRLLNENVHNCSTMVEYKFKAIRVVDDIEVPMTSEITIGQRHCTAPCALRLLPQETVIEFSNLLTKRVKLEQIPSIVYFVEKKNRFSFYTGIPVLVGGALSLVAGFGLAISNEFVKLNLPDGLSIDHILTPTAWAMLSVGVAFSVAGGIAVGLGNKKTREIKVALLQ